MAVALMYNMSDLTALQTTLQTTATALSGADRTLCNRILTAIGDPNTLPLAPAPYQDDAADIRLIVLSYGGATRQGFLDAMLRWFTANPSARGWLRTIWKDARTSAVDPWTG